MQLYPLNCIGGIGPVRPQSLWPLPPLNLCSYRNKKAKNYGSLAWMTENFMRRFFTRGKDRPPSLIVTKRDEFPGPLAWCEEGQHFVDFGLLLLTIGPEPKTYQRCSLIYAVDIGETRVSQTFLQTLRARRMNELREVRGLWKPFFQKLGSRGEVHRAVERCTLDAAIDSQFGHWESWVLPCSENRSTAKVLPTRILSSKLASPRAMSFSRGSCVFWKVSVYGLIQCWKKWASYSYCFNSVVNHQNKGNNQKKKERKGCKVTSLRLMSHGNNRG